MQQRDVQTVGKESNEDVSFDAFVLLMMNGTKGWVALQIAKKGIITPARIDIRKPVENQLSNPASHPFHFGSKKSNRIDARDLADLMRADIFRH